MRLIINIHTEYITLAQLLKMAELVQSGGAAKVFLVHNVVRVNGEVDSRRGRKLYDGDTVITGGETFQVHRLG